MSMHITAGFDALETQSVKTAAYYLSSAKNEIDKLFGQGYAEKNPELVAAYIRTAAVDLQTSVTAKVIGGALEQIAQSIQSLED